MINTVSESRVWQLDMQLMGKVVLSAAALLLLGLAYRFYKFRALERSEQADKHGPGLISAEGDVMDSPQRDDDDSNLRFRRVNSNLQNGLVTDPGRKRFSSLSTHEVHVTAQEGFETADVICKDQNDYGREVTEELHNNSAPLQSHRHRGDDTTSQKDKKDYGREVTEELHNNSAPLQSQSHCGDDKTSRKDQNDYGREVTKELHNNFDPLQSHRHRGDDTTSQKDERDGGETDNKAQSEHGREDPEGREMLENSDHLETVPKNIIALSSIDLSLSHQNETKQELHRFSSKAEVQMQESIIAEDGNALQTQVPGGLRGKIYDYHIESTSQSISAVNTSGTGSDSPQSPLIIITSHLPTSEETPIGLKDLMETTEEEPNSNKVTILQQQQLTSDRNTTDKTTDNGGDIQQTRSSSNVSTTSQFATEQGTSEDQVCIPQCKHTDLHTLEENESMQTSVENTADDLGSKTPDQVNRLQDFSSDINKEQQAESQVTSPSSNTSSFYNTIDQNIVADPCVQTGPGTYHVSLSPETVSDIHIDLGNCYEVLCLAKKHNLETLKRAAYKIMSDDYLQVLQNSSIYGRLNATERDLILEGRMTGRRFVVVADIDTQATSATKNMSSLSYYDNDNDVWHALSEIPVEAVSRGSSMATMFNYLFVVLGCDGPGRQMKPSRHVLCYNPLTGSWKEISPLNEARPHCKLVALGGFLYAIGGECLHTVERYDPRQNRWTYVSPLPNDTFAVAHMATAYDDEIFVTGGTFRYMLLRYREREKVWKSSLLSGSKDRTTEMVASSNFLYRFDLNRSMGISVHRCNIRARIWYECATYPMPYPAPFQCAVIDNHIYCVSRNFHLRFLAEDISPRFVDTNLQTVPSPKGVLFPFVLVLPGKGPH